MRNEQLERLTDAITELQALTRGLAVVLGVLESAIKELRQEAIDSGAWRVAHEERHARLERQYPLREEVTPVDGIKRSKPPVPA